MALYVAICDDSIADRKQFERLLARENDARQTTTGVIYIDSFGSREALMRTPIKYDLFLIDIVAEQPGGMEIAKELRAMGITAPIVLCSSAVDYTAFGSPAADITCLTKPVSKGQLSHLIDVAIELRKTKTPLIEIRGEKDTYFISHLDLVYAVQKEHLIELSLKDGRFIYMLGTPKELWRLLTPYHCFISCKKTIVNLYHVTGTDGNAFVLSTGETIPFSVLQRKELLQAFAKFIAPQ